MATITELAERARKQKAKEALICSDFMVIKKAHPEVSNNTVIDTMLAEYTLTPHKGGFNMPLTNPGIRQILKRNNVINYKYDGRNN